MKEKILQKLEDDEISPQQGLPKHVSIETILIIIT